MMRLSDILRYQTAARRTHRVPDGRYHLLRRAGCAILLTAGMLLASAASAAPAAYDEAVELLEDHRDSAAIVLMRQAAEGGYVPAQRTLAFMLLTGEPTFGPGIAADRYEALQWFRRAQAECPICAYMVKRLEHTLHPRPATDGARPR